MGCDPKCYTKGDGCAISKDGRCVILCAKEGGPPRLNFKEWQKELAKSMITKNVKSERPKKQI